MRNNMFFRRSPKTWGSRSKKFRLEALESRCMLASDLAPAEFDTNSDGNVSPIDVLLIINYLNINGASRIAAPKVASVTPIINEGGSVSLRVPQGYAIGSPSPEVVDAVLSGNELKLTQVGFGDDVVTISNGSVKQVIPVTIKTGPGPHNPTAKADTGQFVKNNPVSLDVLTNDFDIDGDTIEILAVEQAAHGQTAIVQIDGTEGSTQRIAYIPDVNFVGSDSFRYTIKDSTGRESSATVTLNGRNNAAPTVLNPTISVTKNTPSATLVQTQFATDADGDILEVSFEAPDNGVIQKTGTNITYIPNVNFVGTDTVRFSASDGYETKSGFATFVVEEPHFRGLEITRGEGAVAAMAVLGVTPGNYATSSFADVTSGNWAFRAIEEAKLKACFANGFAVGSYYDPNRSLTIGETALLVVNTLKLPGDDFVSASLESGIITIAESNNLSLKATPALFWRAWAKGKNPGITDATTIDIIAHELAALVGGTF